MTPSLLEQAFFVSFNQTCREFFEGERDVSGEFPETVDGAGVQVGGAVAPGASGVFDGTLRKSIYCSHSLNFKMNNELDNKLSQKKI